MRKGDVLFGCGLLGIIIFLMVPLTHRYFLDFTLGHPFMSGFVKFAILASMGELLALRIGGGKWFLPKGMAYRTLIWGLLGIIITLMFNIFASGVEAGLKKGLLPGGESSLAFAFWVSLVMNTSFAPTFMAFHRVTDTFIDLKYKDRFSKVELKVLVDAIDWKGFIGFVLMKTIPFFWIPAHTITFLLPSEYRVLMAAFLSLVLGLILSISKNKIKKGEQIWA